MTAGRTRNHRLPRAGRPGYREAMRPSSLLAAVAAALALAACGADRSCKNACDKLSTCGFSTSGLSCDAKCGGSDGNCAECVNDNSCAEILLRCGGNGAGVCADWNYASN